MAKKELQLLRCLVRCSLELRPLADLARELCPLLRIQRRTLEKLIIEAERLGYIEAIRQGSVKLVRLSESGNRFVTNGRVAE